MKKPIPPKKSEVSKDSNLEIRLNKFVANAGVCSRRAADELIKKGEISVNGKVVFEVGTKISRYDTVEYNGKRIQSEKLRYILLNKPKHFITTVKDEKDRKTVMQLVEKACDERIYPVGRLDRNTTGLLLFTNDGDLAKKLTHPSGNIKKVYKVELNKPLEKKHLESIAQGTQLEDGLMEVDAIALVSADKKEVGIEIHSGKNRIVRRLFEHYGYEVVHLDRTIFAGLDKKDLPRGKWRHLKEKEIITLKYFK